MTEDRRDREWERVMGRSVMTAEYVPLSLTVDLDDGLHLVLNVGKDGSVDPKLIARMLGRYKVPKARTKPRVKFASLPDGQDAEYRRVMAVAA